MDCAIRFSVCAAGFTSWTLWLRWQDRWYHWWRNVQSQQSEKQNWQREKVVGGPTSLPFSRTTKGVSRVPPHHRLSYSAHVAAREDLGGRLRRGIDRLIGVTAGEDKRYDHDRDAEPHGRFPTHWSRPGGRLVDAQGKSAITRSVPEVGISLNSAPSTLIRNAADASYGYRLSRHDHETIKASHMG